MSSEVIVAAVLIIGFSIIVAAVALGSAVGDGIAALLMTRRHLEAHHHKAVVQVDA